MKLSDIKTGDEVIIVAGSNQPYIIATVTRDTPTQFVAAGRLFSRRDGFEVGKPARMAAFIKTDRNDELMTRQEAERHNTELATEREKIRLAQQITGAGRRRLRKLPLETLRRIAELMESEEHNEND